MARAKGICSRLVRYMSAEVSISTAPAKPRLAFEKSNYEADLGKKNVALSVAEQSREYKEKVSKMRKRFIREMERKKVETMRKAHVDRQLLEEAKKKRLALKAGKREIRALEVLQEKEALRLRLEAERVRRVERREVKEHLIASRKGVGREKIRQQSSTWVDEKNLELRVLEAMADPIKLISPPEFFYSNNIDLQQAAIRDDESEVSDSDYEQWGSSDEDEDNKDNF